MQPDNRLLTNLIKCEKEHHSAFLALLDRSHTSLAALSAYASAAAPPVAQAPLGCIQEFAAADEGLRGYAAGVEGWKEELKEVKRVEDEYKAVVKDKEILVGRLIQACKQKISTSWLQAGPAPIPNASYLAPSLALVLFVLSTNIPTVPVYSDSPCDATRNLPWLNENSTHARHT